jgi:hypothetical protein
LNLQKTPRAFGEGLLLAKGSDVLDHLFVHPVVIVNSNAAGDLSKFGLFSSDDKDAIDILKNDHDRVKDLFDQFEKTGGRAVAKRIVRESLMG